MNIYNTAVIVVMGFVSTHSFCMQSREQEMMRIQAQQAAVARTYSQTGQLVPPQVMAQLSAAEQAAARYNNERIIESQAAQQKK